MRNYLVILLLALPTFSIGQNIDSLKKIVFKQIPDVAAWYELPYEQQFEVVHSICEQENILKNRIDSILFHDIRISRIEFLHGRFSGEMFAERFKLVMLAEKYRYDKLVEANFIKLAEIFHHYKEYNSAINLFRKGIESKSNLYSSYANSQIGLCFLELNQLDSAFNRHYLSFKQNENVSSIPGSLNSLGYIKYLNKEYKLAEMYYDSALVMFDKHLNKVDSIQYYIIQSNLSSLFFSLDKKKEAILKLNELIQLPFFRNEENNWLLNELCFKRSKYNYLIGNSAEAYNNIKYMEKIGGFDSTSYFDLKIDILHDLKMINEAVFVQSEYLDFIKRQEENRLLNAQQVQGIYQAQMEAQLKLGRENQKLQIENLRQLSSSNSQLKIINWLIGIISIALILIAFFWVRRRRLNQERKEKYLKVQRNLLIEKEKANKLQNQLEQKALENKKLELQSVLSAADKNEAFVDELLQKLKMISRIEAKKELHSEIIQLRQFLNSYKKKVDVDQLVKDNSELIEQRFKENLQLKYPELTTSDIQLLLFIKLELSTKDIAALKNVEPSSIRMFKYRLKKKLNLDKETSIEDFVTNM